MAGPFSWFFGNAIKPAIQSAAPNWIMNRQGERRATEARNTLAPFTNAVFGSPGVNDAIPQGQGTNNNYFSNIPTDFAQYFQNAGIGANGLGSSYFLPTNPGTADYANAMYQDTMNRYGAQSQMQGRMEGQIGNYAQALQQGTQQYQAGLSNIEQQANAGLSTLEGQRQQGLNMLGEAADTSRMNLMQNLNRIDTQVETFRNEAQNLLQSMYDLKDEALQGAADQTATMLESISMGIESRRAAQIAEIEGNQEIPPAAREAMKQRINFVNGTELHSTAGQVMASEAQRMSALRLSYDTNIKDIGSSITQASGNIYTSALYSTTQAYTQDTAAQRGLAEAGAQLNETFGQLMASYRAGMTTTYESTRQAMVGYATAGQMDMFNMIASTPIAYVDMAPTLGGIMQFNMGMNQAALDRAITDYNTMASQYGMEMQVSMPYFQRGADAVMNAYNQNFANSGGGGGGGGGGGSGASTGAALGAAYMGATGAITSGAASAGLITTATAGGKIVGALFTMGLGALACVSPESMVRTTEGIKPIRDIEIGDKVFGLGEDGYKLYPVMGKDLGKFQGLQPDCVRLNTMNHTLLITAQHDINGRPAASYEPGDIMQVVTKEGEITEEKVLSVIPHPFPEGCDLFLQGNAKYFVGGILVDSVIGKTLEHYGVLPFVM